MSHKNQQYNHLKFHTQYSICEGALKISELAEFCKNNNINVAGISDSFNMCGVLEFSQEVSKIGTQPIIGTQINFAFLNNNLKKIGKISLIAKNHTGYKNLLKLSSISYLSIEKNEDPQCSVDTLLQYSEGVIVLMGGSYSLVSSLIMENNINECENLIKRIQNKFHDNIYIEIQRHGESHEKSLETKLLELAHKFSIPLIATHEVFYINQDMYEAHDAYICVGQKTYVNDLKRLKYSNQHYLKTSDEMRNLFQDLPEALENNFLLPLRCSFRPLPSKPMLPNFSSNSINVDEELKNQAEIGLKVKLENFILNGMSDSYEKKMIEQKYKERLAYEVSMIAKMKFSGYFLIVSD